MMFFDERVPFLIGSNKSHLIPSSKFPDFYFLFFAHVRNSFLKDKIHLYISSLGEFIIYYEIQFCGVCLFVRFVFGGSCKIQHARFLLGSRGMRNLSNFTRLRAKHKMIVWGFDQRAIVFWTLLKCTKNKK